MVARSARAAEDAYQARHQRALLCLTPTVLGRVPAPADAPVVLSLNRGEPARLPGPSGLALAVQVRFRPQQRGDGRDWTAETVGYIYALVGPDGEDLLAYHWHPEGLSRVTRPHVHIAAIRHPVVSARTHLPTGRAELADLVRLLIEELGVPPRRGDWSAVLDAAGEGG